jgi:hypothetical protein
MWTRMGSRKIRITASGHCSGIPLATARLYLSAMARASGKPN